MPLFHSQSGCLHQSSHGSVATIEPSAVRLQIPTVGPLGNRLFGGHRWRVSGTQALAAAGVAEHVVAAMGRWAYRLVMHGCGLRSARSNRNILTDLSAETAQIEADIALLRAELANLGAEASKGYRLLRRKSGGQWEQYSRPTRY